MKLLSVVSIAALSASSLVSAGSWFGGDATTKDAQKVPGDSPLEFCDRDHSSDAVSIEKVDLLPNPPEPGNPLVIQATGTVYERIEEGAYVKLVVKYGLIQLLTTTADLCEQIENVDLKCPVEKGVLSITKSVDMPDKVPPGTYTVYADVYTADDKPITCLQAKITFGAKKTVVDADAAEEVVEDEVPGDL
ncbi:phosphatidylinositol transfer protein [Xylariaceae sp. FL0594]|nr:phosphatidylinositol transfer protein [Xylariaceae sp. FL0594]